MPIPQWRRSLLLAAALGVALAASGCAPTTDAGSPTPAPSASPAATAPASTLTATVAPTPTAASPSASPTATRSGKAVAARVTVQRSGGVAGVTQKIVVETDGRWRYDEGRDAGTAQTGRLGAAQVKRLHLLLGDPSFGSAFYPGSCADGFHYSLLTGQRRVEWDDCGRSSPAEVAEAIVALLTDATPF
ncbi:hypothetical protein [Micromonospora sp. NPDC003776]